MSLRNLAVGWKKSMLFSFLLGLAGVTSGAASTVLFHRGQTGTDFPLSANICYESALTKDYLTKCVKNIESHVPFLPGYEWNDTPGGDCASMGCTLCFKNLEFYGGKIDLCFCDQQGYSWFEDTYYQPGVMTETAGPHPVSTCTRNPTVLFHRGQTGTDFPLSSNICYESAKTKEYLTKCVKNIEAHVPFLPGYEWNETPGSDCASMGCNYCFESLKFYDGIRLCFCDENTKAWFDDTYYKTGQMTETDGPHPDPSCRGADAEPAPAPAAAATTTTKHHFDAASSAVSARLAMWGAVSLAAIIL